jgi:transposase-like protein
MESRRKFTREFKWAAVQRLRAGEAVEGVARSLEVNRQDCTAGAEMWRSSGRGRFPAWGRSAWICESEYDNEFKCFFPL